MITTIRHINTRLALLGATLLLGAGAAHAECLDGPIAYKGVVPVGFLRVCFKADSYRPKAAIFVVDNGPRTYGNPPSGSSLVATRPDATYEFDVVPYKGPTIPHAGVDLQFHEDLRGFRRATVQWDRAPKTVRCGDWAQLRLLAILASRKATVTFVDARSGGKTLLVPNLETRVFQNSMTLVQFLGRSPTAQGCR